MAWDLFWTIIAQVVIACFLLSLPISLIVTLVCSAWELGTRRPETKNEGHRIL